MSRISADVFIETGETRADNEISPVIYMQNIAARRELSHLRVHLSRGDCNGMKPRFHQDAEFRDAMKYARTHIPIVLLP